LARLSVYTTYATRRAEMAKVAGVKNPKMNIAYIHNIVLWWGVSGWWKRHEGMRRVGGGAGTDSKGE
jgi:hypothetical protein